jgi:hypothetical protein
MTAQSMQNVMHAGAPVPDSEAQKTMCEAFKTAFTKYCAKPKPRGKFNDYFYTEFFLFLFDDAFPLYADGENG